MAPPGAREAHDFNGKRARMGFAVAMALCLVTGSSGFLGTSLARRLLGEGHSVRLLGRSAPPEDLQGRVEWVQADLGEPVSLAGSCSGCEVVFHTAAKVGIWGRRNDYERINIRGTQALLEDAKSRGVRAFVHTSTPSVVYNGRPISGGDESMPLTHAGICPAAYPVSKAEAERLVLGGGTGDLRTVALRPHLIWGPGDRHLVPRVVARARAGRLRIVGEGRNRVDLVHIENCVDAHLLAWRNLVSSNPGADGRAFFITNGEPVYLWEFVNSLLARHGVAPVTRRIPLGVATAAGSLCEGIWSLFRLKGEPPMTRFLAKELATDHWFSIEAARRTFGYQPRISMAGGLASLPV